MDVTDILIVPLVNEVLGSILFKVTLVGIYFKHNPEASVNSSPGPTNLIGNDSKLSP
jgi:hypothetical protein